MTFTEKTTLLALAKSQFGSLEPEGFKLKGFNETARATDVSLAIEYTRRAMKAAKEGAAKNKLPDSPLYDFIINRDFEGDFIKGERYWVGLIPLEADEATNRSFIDETAEQLTKIKSAELELGQDESDLLRKLYRNSLIAIVHSNLKAASKVPALNTDLNLNGHSKREFLSFDKVIGGIEKIYPSFESSEQTDEDAKKALIDLMVELGFFEKTPSKEVCEQIYRNVEKHKREAWELYISLAKTLEDGQDMAGVGGETVKIDPLNENSTASYIELCGRAVGRIKDLGKSDQYETQLIAYLTFLIFQIGRSKAKRVVETYAGETYRRFTHKFFNDSGHFGPEEEIRVYHDERHKKLQEIPSDPDARYEPFDVHVVDLKGYHDKLSREERMIYRGSYRVKELIPILLKMLKSKVNIENIPDLLAGQCVLMGISENDFNEKKVGHERVKLVSRFIEDLADEAGKSIGLSRAPDGAEYADLPPGQYLVKSKVSMTTNKDSFQFPDIKIYMCIPIGEANEGKFVRFEYRFLPYDTYLRSEKDKKSMSHHKVYKLKQSMELGKLFIRRSSNKNYHRVRKGVEAFIKGKEEAEAKELEAV